MQNRSSVSPEDSPDIATKLLAVKQFLYTSSILSSFKYVLLTLSLQNTGLGRSFIWPSYNLPYIYWNFKQILLSSGYPIQVS